MKADIEKEIGSTLVRAAERAASTLPSSTFLIAAVGSLAASAVLRWAGKKGFAMVVGELIPTLVLVTLYRKFAAGMSSSSSRRGLPGARGEGLPQQAAANLSAAATPGVPL
jgi:hypothetical protein